MTSRLPDLSSLALASPPQPGGDPAVTWREYRDVIRLMLANDPRSLQVEIGPSELGTPCDRCLARKLAGIPEANADVEPWLPFIGRCAHDGLATGFGTFGNAYANDHRKAMTLLAGPDSTAFKLAPSVRFMTEVEVEVGVVGGREVTGHCDLYDLATAEATDWKVVGATTLRDVKANGPRAAYHAQIHLYGRGLVRRGLPVHRVRVAYLPRNSMTLSDAYVWTEDYDERVALDALDRADRIHTMLEVVGHGVIEHLPTDPSCHDCHRFDKSSPKPGHRTRDAVDDLIGPR